jgi:hypothetical protein
MIDYKKLSKKFTKKLNSFKLNDLKNWIKLDKNRITKNK